MTAVDPGATPTAARAPAPDLARGFMLLLIALANVNLYGYGRPPGIRGYPGDVDGAERWVTLAQMTLVDGRAYPMFGLLFGYGIVQLAWRRAAVGLPAEAVTRLVRRRGAWLVLIGLAHGVLLWSGDIVGAYGLLAVLMAGMLVRGTNVSLLVTAGIGLGIVTLLSAAAGFEVPSPLGSIGTPDAVAALGRRAFEWITGGLLSSAIGVFAAVALGAWAGRRRLLDEPERHRRQLTWLAAVGIGGAVVGGLPLAAMAAQVWDPPLALALLAGSAHSLSGYLGGIGYAALFGLLAIRLAGRTGPGTRALRACGQRSLSCYVAQSVAFVALFPAWSLGLGEGARVWQTASAGVGVWLVILLVAAVSERAGYRGPAEALLRRLTYGVRRPVTR